MALRWRVLALPLCWPRLPHSIGWLLTWALDSATVERWAGPWLFVALLPGDRVRPIHHFCVVADPGSHSYTECLVSLVWAWEAQLGVCPPWQVSRPGKKILEGEAVLDNHVGKFRRSQKLTRIMAYRQIQGISHQIYLMTGKQHGIEAFQMPPGSNLRPVRQHESRVPWGPAGGVRPLCLFAL